MITSVSNPDIIQTAKLKQKKYRDLTGQFLIEGIKLTSEAINNHIQIEKIFILPELINKLPNKNNFEIIEVNKKIIKKLSSQKNPEGIIALVKKDSINFNFRNNKFILLDEISDPGNLGTIIRTADAAGYEAVFCSPNCADLYNEKTIRSTMGSIFHIPVIENINLIEKIEELKVNKFRIYGTSLDGEILYLNQVKVPEKFALVLGNESHGISSEIQNSCTQLLKLPIFGKSESLNVSIAAGIFMYAFTDQFIS